MLPAAAAVGITHVNARGVVVPSFPSSVVTLIPPGSITGKAICCGGGRDGGRRVSVKPNPVSISSVGRSVNPELNNRDIVFEGNGESFKGAL